MLSTGFLKISYCLFLDLFKGHHQVKIAHHMWRNADTAEFDEWGHCVLYWEYVVKSSQAFGFMSAPAIKCWSPNVTELHSTAERTVKGKRCESTGSPDKIRGHNLMRNLVSRLCFYMRICCARCYFVVGVSAKRSSGNIGFIFLNQWLQNILANEVWYIALWFRNGLK